MASKLIVACFLLFHGQFYLVHAGPCEVNGSSSIIVDIEESRALSIDQEPIPLELPVSGIPNVDMFLDLIFTKGNPVFYLDGKKLKLLSPLDRDKDALSHIVFQLTCTIKATHKKKTIPVIVRLIDINDNAPEFVNTPYETSISELTPVGTTIFQNVLAKDKDIGGNGLVEYSIVPGSSSSLIYEQTINQNRVASADGYGVFAINLPHQGKVTVNRTLDYEKIKRYYVTIIATDKPKNPDERLTSTTTLIVNIKDDDDQNPSFIYKGCMLLDGACINPEYHATVSSGVLHGVLDVSPEKIQAVDMDTLNYPVTYSFVSGTPEFYADYFRIDPNIGTIHQMKSVDSNTAKNFEIIIKAQEKSEAKRSTTAKLFINVTPVDANPPEIYVSSSEGFVDENSPVGTIVLDAQKNPIEFTVEDKDLGPNELKPEYIFELTTPYFVIDKKGYLIVNDNNLDRDPPSPGKFRFQVVVKEKFGVAASAPTSITVVLNDVNDNPPILPSYPPVTVPAGDGKRTVMTVKATDKDEGKNAEIKYSIYHISNNGNGKFVINRTTGVLETNEKLNAGEQYSLTIQAMDSGGLYSQTIVEITVTPGPNTQSPVFEQSVYEVEISEGATINSTVTTVVAIDPENDPVTYSIISGNDLLQFAIGIRSGIITVIRKLDREELTRYRLIIKAEDDGKLFSTATVNIKVTDVNDKNPNFIGDPYTFSVKEGLNKTSVGFVLATDADEGINALVSYSIPSNLPFEIDSETGEITTKQTLDYEKRQNYQFVVTAKDGAPDPRIATATVMINVIDVEDELPVFDSPLYEATVPENTPDFFVTDVTARDPDTVKKITYVIHQGPVDLFRINGNTGAIFTTRGLDYEKESLHVLIIGTLENMLNTEGSTTKVIVKVEDRNDIPPVFTTLPHPITLDDDVSIGTSVTHLVAADSDGTSPNNKVRYEVIGRGKSTKYFQIDPDTGILKVINDLRRELDTEYQVDVRAYDLGEPQLSSVITVDVYIQHVATVAPEIGLRFTDTSYSAQVPENSTSEMLIKTLTIVNSKTHGTNVPLKCVITDGNKNGLFKVNVTEDRNCALYLNGSLDFETEESYHLVIELMSIQGFLNHDFKITKITINVADVNDNIPYFIYPSGSKNDKYYAAVTKTTPVAYTVIQIKADDKDNGKFGKIKYSLSGNHSKDFFSIDPNSGIVKTRKGLDSDLPLEQTFYLIATARDNPNSTSDFHEVNTSLIVNIISEENRIILVIGDAKPEVIATKLETVQHVIQEQTGLIVGIEKISPKEFINENGTLEVDPTATDVWFHLIDPETDGILDNNHTLVRRAVYEKQAMNNITFDVSGQIKHTASEIHQPLEVPKKHKSTAIASLNGEVFPYALIVIACIIFVFGIIGIIYITVSWSRYKSYKSQLQRAYSAPSSPVRYDTVYVEPNLKEYETQVLQMCVPVDDNDDYNDLHLDFSKKSHVFNLDNVTYISKENNINKTSSQRSPMGSESTARASSVGDHDAGKSGNNHMYEGSLDDEELSTSPTNENVTFREKKKYSHLGYLCNDPSIETTTEL